MQSLSKDKLIIQSLDVFDIRFPTSKEFIGSDAMHTNPDYSCAYVVLKTNCQGLEGHGLTFTLGKGTEVIVSSIEAQRELVIGKSLGEIFKDFPKFLRLLTSEPQLRWIGPEKGVVHLGTAAIVNAIWDLAAKFEEKPLWKMLVDMKPEEIVELLDFRYVTDALTKQEALEILKGLEGTKKIREEEMVRDGYPAYTTSAGWLGYSDEKVRSLCKEAISQGYNHIKIKVGQDLKEDIRRLELVRSEIGPERKLMVDANQKWEVQESIDYMKQLSKFNIWWIEEPTSPDDILGHATIATALKPLNIGVATGEQCQNRIIFKQLLQAKSISFCQPDSCRLGGVNEVLLVFLMSKKFQVPVCMHAGGVGLCEYVNHLCMFDYICVSGSLENRVTEFVDHLHEHFVNPVIMKGSRYTTPKAPGYSAELKKQSTQQFQFINSTPSK
ncbi:hypothetical protein DLAC_05649 [Tieghemostelium lacteum]|uniref:L-fuconate dehydratase n=1 Tax=Tieghemostelium lacteum TaxID=361077 RepID=A0A151ZGN9_TIELA|nr:hypothetical protein DLAC_05649 [Tieghemostelium lacteum]|eukprot:KYQ93040.1 hypothetical protein DLAC_05649 [Tieghemostelium lacteum]